MNEVAGSQDILATLDLLDIPAFLLTVEPDTTIRFGGLNAAHERRTGIESASIVGKTPHEVLPKSLAETVAANYRLCIETAERLSYTEVLELASGPRHWKTTLSPIIENGTVTAIIGAATDITTFQARLAKLQSELTELRRESASMRTISHISLTQMRGPWNNVLSLARMLGADADEDLGENMDLLAELAASALDQIDRYERERQDETVARAQDKELDFGRLCREIAGNIDPSRQRSISFSEGRIVANAEMLRTVLHTLISVAVDNTESWVGIAMAPDPLRRQAIRIHVRCAVLPATSAAAFDRRRLDACAAMRGADLQLIDGDGIRAPSGTITIQLTIDGKLVGEESTGSPTLPGGRMGWNRINRSLSDHANG